MRRRTTKSSKPQLAETGINWLSAWRRFETTLRHCPPESRELLWALVQAVRRRHDSHAGTRGVLVWSGAQPEDLQKAFASMDEETLLKTIHTSAVALQDIAATHVTTDHVDYADAMWAITRIHHARMELESRLGVKVRGRRGA